MTKPGEPSHAPRAAEIYENRYRAVGEYAQSASFDVAELDAWAVSNRVPGSFSALLTPDSVGADLPSVRRFQPCSSLLVLIASAFVPADMEPHEAQAQLLAAGDTGEYPNAVNRLRDLIMGRYERLLLGAAYDGDLNLYDTLTYTKIDVTAGRRRYEAQSEFHMPDEPRQRTGRKPVELALAPPSIPVQFILHSGNYARASAGEIVLPADTAHVPVYVVIGLTVSAATIQFPNYVNVYEREGIDASDAGEVKFEHVDGRDEAERLAPRHFPAACKAIGIRPRNPYSPYADDYIGTPEQNAFYELTVDELRKYAEPYGVTVMFDGETSASVSEVSKQNVTTTIPLSAHAPAPLPTPVIAAAFDGISSWNASQWSRALGDGRTVWLNKARKAKGRPGVGPATWSPITIALGLRDKGVGWSALDTVFKKAALREWREQWELETEILRD